MVQVSPKELDLGTPEYNSMIQDINYVGIDPFVLLMFLLHNIYHATVEEIKERKHTVYK